MPHKTPNIPTVWVFCSSNEPVNPPKLINAPGAELMNTDPVISINPCKANRADAMRELNFLLMDINSAPADNVSRHLSL